MSIESSRMAFFDTNVLLYLLVGGDPRQEIAKRIVRDGGCTSVQALNEFVSVSRYKLDLEWTVIENRLRRIYLICERIIPLTEETHRHAFTLAGRYGYHIYDANILASALFAGCDTLYSEDMQDGQRIETLTIRNPFTASAP